MIFARHCTPLGGPHSNVGAGLLDKKRLDMSGNEKELKKKNIKTEKRKRTFLRAVLGFLALDTNPHFAPLGHITVQVGVKDKGAALARCCSGGWS